MDILNAIWEYIGRTNLFNFIIFLSVFIIIFKCAKLGNKIEEARQNIASNIKESDDAKEESADYLQEIQNDIANLEQEISDIIEQSDNNAKNVGEKILDDAEKQVELIKENAQKSIENRTLMLKNDITTRAALASIEVAKNHIINELNNNQGLHDKLIDESIETIEGAYNG